MYSTLVNKPLNRRDDDESAGVVKRGRGEKPKSSDADANSVKAFYEALKTLQKLDEKGKSEKFNILKVFGEEVSKS